MYKQINKIWRQKERSRKISCEKSGRLPMNFKPELQQSRPTITFPSSCLTQISPLQKSSYLSLGFSVLENLTCILTFFQLLSAEPSKMADANNETDLEIYYNSEANSGDKRKREGKLRSKVWQHFTKLMKEDGSCEKCQCNHCQKLFTCSSKSGTTHLLRHITDGICPAFKKDLTDKTLAISMRGGGTEYKFAALPWKFDQGPSLSSTQQSVEAELLHERIVDPDHPTFKENDNEVQTPVSSRGKLPQKSALKSQPKGEAWMIEFKSCVTKLVELANGRIPVGSLQALAVNTPDYSIATTLKCLNEMEDIPQSSEMYLDAFEILQDAGERECFICLPPEPRRRWLQRILHRRHPLRYSSSV